MSDDLRITLDKHVLDALQRSLPGRADDLIEALPAALLIFFSYTE